MIVTTEDIYKGTIMYGVIRGIWWTIKQAVKTGIKELQNERAKLIKQHKKDGHSDRLKFCIHPDCQQLRHL